MKKVGKHFTPRIGIFWFVKTGSRHRLVCLGRDVDCVTTIGGFKTIDEGHVDVWGKLTAAHKSLARFDYDYFPRGRVNWREEDATYLVLADPSIFNLGLHKEIIDRWNLGKEALHLSTDAHYLTNKLPSLFSRGGIA